MKKLYLIGGTVGVGKTSMCQMLKTKLPASVFLDGDLCWDRHPFQVIPETKWMVLKNIHRYPCQLRVSITKIDDKVREYHGKIYSIDRLAT